MIAQKMTTKTNGKASSETTKIPIGRNVFICPMPVTIVGTRLNNRPNFLTVGWVTRVNVSPPMIAIGIKKSNASADGILMHKAFSVNFPGTDLIEETDYCGLVSGRDKDKSRLFDIFYGDLKNAPMIKNCPITLECLLTETIDLPTNYLFIGEIKGAYGDENCFTSGKPDVAEIKPLLLTMPDNAYWEVGKYLGRACKIGRNLET
ncbi:flavin reductase family protein [Methanogenium sp. S4BF]|uniref:flavin reductase family protein n=1 Tax=Methanogenium sp. S4BF TaxID=1789226 RepID=UPI002416A100|nr:flavin reductase family protein [Methanogenium sp. S4BF]WFN33985.1 flavin reductase family protein [Methanogenium sp. S4BF]